MDEYTPPTQPDASLVPPSRVPPTAIAVATPPPPPHRRDREPFTRTNDLRVLFARTLDAVDEFADAVASGLGLRAR